MIAAIGNVSSHDNNMPEITFTLAFLVAVPIPNKEPTETCVVETGNPLKLAVETSKAVTRLAVNPCP